MELTKAKGLKKHWVAFFLAMGLACIIFIPLMIYDRGYFFFFGDFNVQQIPFYQLAHQAVRSGEFFWNWKTDLGANFIGSYSFYLLFSPFFWLTLPFPTSFVPHLMGPLLILKTGCAALTSYLFLQRFVRNKDYAVIGSILYAFSGFAIYNVFFNHFHEAIIFFPLLLIGLEELVMNDRRGLFALTVAINCAVNYWFFIGEVVFVVIYVFVRMTSSDWKMTVKKFCWIAAESVLGLLLAMGALLPSVLAVMGNPRTTADNLLNGWNFWLYWDKQRLPAILQSLFFPPDLPSRPNFFPDHGAKWASLSAWLPLFSTVGVISYFFWAKKSWLKKMLAICFFLALTPGTNSLFILFNHSYYARWFYMPILLMCLATIITLERREVDLRRGFRWTAGAVALFTIAIGFTPIKRGEDWEVGLMAEPARFWLSVGVAVFCLAAVWWLIRFWRYDKKFIRLTLILVSFVSVFHGLEFIINGKVHSDKGSFLRDTALAGREELVLPEEPFARSDLYKSMDNLGMYWDLPNIQAFHSIIPNSIMEFYPLVGVKRDVSSKPDVSRYALRPLLSVRWFFLKETAEEEMEDLMPGWSYYDSQLGYEIYENDNYLPMGFGYTNMFSEDFLMETPTDMRSRVMLRAVCLQDPEAMERNADLLTELEEIPYAAMGPESLAMDVDMLRVRSCKSFEIDRHGFTAKSDLPQETFMFFSVPYDRGWQATVNGEPAIVEKANVGFMAVRVPAGESVIRFDYHTPGLKTGLCVSAGALAVLVLYLLWARKNVTVGASVLSTGSDENPLREEGGAIGPWEDGSAPEEKQQEDEDNG